MRRATGKFLARAGVSVRQPRDNSAVLSSRLATPLPPTKPSSPFTQHVCHSSTSATSSENVDIDDQIAELDEIKAVEALTTAFNRRYRHPKLPRWYQFQEFYYQEPRPDMVVPAFLDIALSNDKTIGLDSMGTVMFYAQIFASLRPDQLQSAFMQLFVYLSSKHMMLMKDTSQKQMDMVHFNGLDCLIRAMWLANTQPSDAIIESILEQMGSTEIGGLINSIKQVPRPALGDWPLPVLNIEMFRAEWENKGTPTIYDCNRWLKEFKAEFGGEDKGNDKQMFTQYACYCTGGFNDAAFAHFLVTGDGRYLWRMLKSAARAPAVPSGDQGVDELLSWRSLTRLQEMNKEMDMEDPSTPVAIGARMCVCFLMERYRHEAVTLALNLAMNSDEFDDAMERNVLQCLAGAVDYLKSQVRAAS